MAREDQSGDGQAGFSLIELLIALVATMVIAGAIFGLLTAGNTAFRREPELADRQQNIRIAMSVISEDINRAGISLPQFQQVFMQGLDGAGPMGPNGENTDEIQMITSSDCPVLPVCKSPGINVVHHAAALALLPASERGSSSWASIATDEPKQRAWMQWAEKPGTGFVAACGADNGQVNLPAWPGPDPEPPRRTGL